MNGIQGITTVLNSVGAALQRRKTIQFLGMTAVDDGAKTTVTGNGGLTPISTTEFSVTGTMTVAPAGEVFRVIVTGAGASGCTAAGSFGADSVQGGAGGGGGARAVVEITRAELVAALPITVTVGTGGAEPGPLAVPMFGGTIGLPGIAGTHSAFGGFCAAYGGGFGTNSLASTNPGGAGGGRYADAVVVTGVDSTGGGPLGSTGLSAALQYAGPDGGTGSHRQRIIPPPFATWGGAAGANANTSANPGDRSGGISEFGGGGGGCGGGALTGTAFDASEGGLSGIPVVGVLGGGGGAIGATIPATQTPGNDGSAGAAGNNTRSGAGGGGGSSVTDGPNGSVSGAGGAGGYPGGGGGGGGAMVQESNLVESTSATGGAGGGGQVLILGYGVPV